MRCVVLGVELELDGAIDVLECIDGRNENRYKSCNVQEVKIVDSMGIRKSSSQKCLYVVKGKC